MHQYTHTCTHTHLFSWSWLSFSSCICAWISFLEATDSEWILAGEVHVRSQPFTAVKHWDNGHSTFLIYSALPWPHLAQQRGSSEEPTTALCRALHFKTCECSQDRQTDGQPNRVTKHGSRGRGLDDAQSERSLFYRGHVRGRDAVCPTQVKRNRETKPPWRTRHGSVLQQGLLSPCRGRLQMRKLRLQRVPHTWSTEAKDLSVSVLQACGLSTKWNLSSRAYNSAHCVVRILIQHNSHYKAWGISGRNNDN